MSQKYQVQYSPSALSDLRNTYSYIAFHFKEVRTAKNQVQRIRNAIADLSSFPSRYPPVLWEPWNGKGLHKLPVDRYVVYYLVNDEEHMVNIVRIFYGGRDAERLLQEPH